MYSDLVVQGAACLLCYFDQVPAAAIALLMSAIAAGTRAREFTLVAVHILL